MSSSRVRVSFKEAKTELMRRIDRAQVMVAYIGSCLQLPWMLSDYFLMKEHFVFILTLRLIASFIPITICFFRNQLKISSTICVFITALSISIVDAIMANMLPENEFKSFSITYVVLFIGIGMLATWETIYSVVLVCLSLLLNILLFIFFSPLTLEEYIVDGELSIFTVAIFSVVMVNARFKLNINEIKARLELEKSKKLIENQKEEVLSSIRYGKRIQEAMLMEEEKISDFFTENFILFKPKDIVSGDFYWTAYKDGWFYLAVGDCTGHGVPGAFLSMLGTSFLNDYVANSVERLSPNTILDALRNKILKDLSNKSKETENRDGMDISLIAVNTLNGNFEWSGANNCLWIAANFDEINDHGAVQKFNSTGILELIGDKQPIGYHERMKPFSNHKGQLKKEQMVYLFSDGYADQFGGEKGKKLRVAVMKEMIAGISHLPAEKQQEELDNKHEKWKGLFAQTDDICVVGFRYSPTYSFLEN